MSEDFQPREHDHLVEPMFGGLGLEGQPVPKVSPEGAPGWLRRLWRALLSLWRPSRPADGP